MTQLTKETRTHPIVSTVREPAIAWAPVVGVGGQLRLDALGANRWRVVEPPARIIGHLDAVDVGGGVRYRARRYHSPTRSLVVVGEFWRRDDALDALRHSR
jgi:hypothetical protein